MLIFIHLMDEKTLMDEKVIELHNVQPSETVYDLKCYIQATEGISPGQQTLFHGGKELGDEDMLCNHQIQNESKIDLVLSMRGN
jgi:Ubiquitin family